MDIGESRQDERKIIERAREAYIPHPWRRFFARGFDMFFYGAVFLTVMFLAFKAFPHVLLVPICQLVLMFIFEPIFLHFWGTTPGKWLMNIHIRNGDGIKLSYEEALVRTWAVFAEGNGYYVPIYSAYRNYDCFKACEKGGMPWDEELELSCGAWGGLRGAAYAAAHALLIGAVVLSGLTLALPPNRGELTVAEFAENCNYYLKDDAFNMSSEGKWLQREYTVMVWQRELSYPELDFTVENGAITGLSYDISYTGDISVSEYNRLATPAQVFMLSQRQVNIFNGEVWRIDKIPEEFFKSGTSEAVIGGIKLVWTIESENVQLLGPFGMTDGEENGYIHISLSAHKIQ